MCWVGLQSYAQGPDFWQFEGLDTLYRKVKGFGVGLPQEKAYLHLDNTCYFLGDTIWYKGYVTRSDRGTLTDLSKILYVELLTPDGYSVERQQLEMEDGTAHGMFVLKDTLYAGYYELRAYTRWMLNFGQCEYPHVRISEDLFYSKKMAKEFFRDYEKLYSRVFPVYDKPKEAGDFAKDMTLRPMRRYYKTPKKKKPKVDLRFYPEGGNLVAGAACRVALELNGEDGQHLGGMKLTVRDKEGKVAAVCRTDERGRTTFRLPDVSEQADFRATFTYKGYEYEEELPEVEKEGCALTVTVGDSVVEAVIQAVGVKRPVALHVMSGGVSRFYRPLPVSLFSNGMADTADEPASGLRVCRMAIPLDSLPTGVNQLTVLTGKDASMPTGSFSLTITTMMLRNWPFPASASPMNLSIPSPCICNWPTRRIPYPAFPLPFATGIRKKIRTTMARYSPKCSLPVKSRGLWRIRVIISSQTTVFAAKPSIGS